MDRPSSVHHNLLVPRDLACRSCKLVCRRAIWAHLSLSVSRSFNRLICHFIFEPNHAKPQLLNLLNILSSSQGEVILHNSVGICQDAVQGKKKHISVLAGKKGTWSMSSRVSCC